VPDHPHRRRYRRVLLALPAGLVVAAVVIVIGSTIHGDTTESQPPGTTAPPDQPPTSVSTPATTSATSTLPGAPPPGGGPPRSSAQQPGVTTLQETETAPTTAGRSEQLPVEPTVHIHRDVTLDRYSWVDLDSSAYNPSYGGDLYYGQDANTLEFFFQPMSESQIWQANGTTQDLEACKATQAPSEKITLDGLPGGSVVCVRTTDGRYSGVKVIRPVEGPSGRSYDINYLTWERE
jgi:hypothetical protein